MCTEVEFDFLGMCIEEVEFDFLGMYTEVEFDFLRIYHTVFHSNGLLTFPLAMHEGASFSTAFPTFILGFLGGCF
jgi:hypothetical protein